MHNGRIDAMKSCDIPNQCCFGCGFYSRTFGDPAFVLSNKLHILMKAHVPQRHLDSKLEASVPTSRSLSIVSFMLAAFTVWRFKKSWQRRANHHCMFAVTTEVHILNSHPQQRDSGVFTHACKSWLSSRSICRHAIERFTNENKLGEKCSRSRYCRPRMCA